MTKPNKPYGIIWSQNVDFVTTVPLTRRGVLYPRVRDFWYGNDPTLNFSPTSRQPRATKFGILHILRHLDSSNLICMLTKTSLMNCNIKNLTKPMKTKPNQFSFKC